MAARYLLWLAAREESAVSNTPRRRAQRPGFVDNLV